MERNRRTKRLYTIPDGKLLLKAEYFLKMAGEDIHYLSDFDKDITPNWLLEKQETIALAMQIPEDKIFRKEIAQGTNDLKERMKKCYDLVLFAEYFIKKAFPNNRGIISSFGIRSIRQYRRKEDEFIKSLDSFRENTINYREQLAASGYNEVFYNELRNSIEMLHGLSLAKSNLISRRLLLTETRIQYMNTIWEFIKRLSTIGKLVFADNPEKKRGYNLPKIIRKKREDHTEHKNSYSLTTYYYF